MIALPAFAHDDRIVNVDGAVCAFPLRHALTFGRIRYESRTYVFVRITTDSGARGYGVALERGSSFFSEVNEIARVLVGLAPAVALSRLSQLKASARARSVVDLALWDAISRGSKLSLGRLLGSPGRTKVPVTVAAGYLRDIRGDDAVVDEVEMFAKQGFPRIKIMLDGRETNSLRPFLERCLERAGAAQTSVDFHYSFDTLSSARSACQRIDLLGLQFIEDALRPGLVSELTELAQSLRTPLAGGEDVSTPEQYRDLLPIVDPLRIDAGTCGGIGVAMNAIDLATEAKVKVFPHGSPWLGAQFAAISPTVDAVEIAAPVDNGDLLAALCDVPPLPIQNGHLTIDDRPGLDLVPRWDAVGHAASDTFSAIAGRTPSRSLRDISSGLTSP